jgi:hypothetical protein
MVRKSLTRWRGGVAAVLLGALLLALTTAQEVRPAREEVKTSDLPSDLAKIPSDGTFVFSIRVADLWARFAAPVRDKEIVATTSRQLEKLWGVPPEQVERWTMVFLDPPTGPQEPLYFLRTIKPYEKAKVLAAGKNVKEDKYKGQILYIGDKKWSVYPLDDRSLVYGEPDDLRKLIDRPAPKTAGDLAGALRLSAEKHALVCGANVKSVNDAIGKQLPGEVEPFRPLLKAIAGTLTVDVDAEARAVVSVSFPSEREARSAVKSAQAGLDLFRSVMGQGVGSLTKEPDTAEIVQMLKQVQAALKSAKIEQRGKILQGSARLKFDAGKTRIALQKAVQKVRESSVRLAGLNNLHNIVVAMQNYHTSFGRFPPQATYDKDGKPMLSWRVMLLLFLDEADLYKQFHLNEPWDSEHNKKLLPRMPKVYAAPQDEKAAKQFLTYYQGFAGKGTIFDGKKGIRSTDIIDGTSNTIMIVEASKAVPWTKPEDVPYDPAKPLPKLGILGSRNFSAAFCDGSVRTITPRTSERTLRAAITRDEGEPLGRDFE